jgi:HSP20 family molecular chaperone IbpA
MSSDDDFGDIFDNFNFFTDRLTKRFRAEIDQILKQVKSGKLKGTFETREISEPGVRGYIIQGRFGSDREMEPLEPMEPLKPSQRRPLPKEPFELSKEAFKETREPLTDIFEEENAIKIYVELPGESEENIHLRATEEGVEVKSENFYKMIKLHGGNLDKQKMSSKYRNGVLEIAIPRVTRFQGKPFWKERQV